MKVVMSWEAFRLMRAYVNSSYPKKDEKNDNATLKEITGWGTVEQTKNGDLFVDEVFLMKQEATAAHVEMDMDGWAEVVGELAADGQGDKLSKLNMWWHSHPFAKGPGERKPEFSNIDTDTMEKFQVNDGFLLSIVTDQYGMMTARYDQWTPVRQRIELEVTVEQPALYQEDLDEVREEVLVKVTFPEPKVVSYGGTGKWGQTRYGGGGDRHYWQGKPKGQGRWVVWRIPTSGQPYENERFKKKKEAEEHAETLTKQMSTPQYPAKYIVMELPDKPDSDGKALPRSEDKPVTMYCVRRVGGSFDISSHGSVQAAQVALTEFIERLGNPSFADDYEIVEVQHKACVECGFYNECDGDGLCDDCVAGADFADLNRIEQVGWEGSAGRGL